MGDGIHRRHCCYRHGCKYGQEDDCPVVLGTIRQTFLCGCCDEEGIKLVNDLHKGTDYIALIRKNDINSAELIVKDGKLFIKTKISDSNIVVAEVEIIDLFYQVK